MIWTIAVVDETCGGCDGPIPPDQPMATFTNARKRRCVACAARMGVPLNHAEVDLERFRLERERLDRQVAAPFNVPAPYFHRPRRMASAAELAENLKLFDPKAAALGDRDR